MRFLALALLALASAVPAQTRNETHSPLGLSLVVPRSYAPMPVQPTEELVQLRYLGRESARGLRPDLYVVRIPWGEDPDPLPDPPPVHTFARYLEQRMRPWSIAETTEKEPIDGWVALEHRLERVEKDERGRRVAPERPSAWAAWALERQDGFQSYLVLGFCDVRDFDQEVKRWRQVAQKLAFFAPTAAAEEEKWARYYKFHPEFRNGELRTRMRSRLLDGWGWEDTPNYVLLTNSDKAMLIRDLQKKLEGIRKYYLERFPPVAEITALATVRVCKDRDEYIEYGGWPESGGYWNPLARELVFYDGGKEDTRIVLYHEAFHQYVYYAVGEVRPHPWFNEGYGDYFSGAEFNTYGDVLRMRLNPWRTNQLQSLIGQHPSWAELIRMEQAEFMTLDPGRNYQMAWSMVYFLEEAKAVEKNPRWARILPTYYETLKTAFTEERRQLSLAGQADDPAELEVASARARARAVQAAFEGVDLHEIEFAWIQFLRELKLPK